MKQKGKRPDFKHAVDDTVQKAVANLGLYMGPFATAVIGTVLLTMPILVVSIFFVPCLDLECIGNLIASVLIAAVVSVRLSSELARLTYRELNRRNPSVMMWKAEHLIRQKRYPEAYDALYGIDHPKAVEWRSKLEQRLPIPSAEQKMKEPLTLKKSAVQAIRLAVAGFITYGTITIPTDWLIAHNRVLCDVNQSASCTDLPLQQIVLLAVVGVVVFKGVWVITKRAEKVLLR